MDPRNFYKTRAGKAVTGALAGLTIAFGGLGASEALAATPTNIQNPYDVTAGVEFGCSQKQIAEKECKMSTKKKVETPTTCGDGTIDKYDLFSTNENGSYELMHSWNNPDCIIGTPKTDTYKSRNANSLISMDHKYPSNVRFRFNGESNLTKIQLEKSLLEHYDNNGKNDSVDIYYFEAPKSIPENKVTTQVMKNDSVKGVPATVDDKEQKPYVPAVSTGLGYMFDINGDGHIDNLTILENGKIKRDLGNNNIQYTFADTTRRDILEAIRFADKNGDFNRKTAKGYLLTQTPKDVVEFMADTNEFATPVTGDRKNYEANKPTKLENSIAWAAFIDKVANLNARGNVLLEAMVEYNPEGLKVKDNEESRLAYATTHAQKRTLGSFLLNWGLGSAIYDTIQSDFRPLVEANSTLARSKGSNFNSIVRNVETNGYSAKVLNESLDDTIKMYDDQLWAAKATIGGDKK